MAIITKKIETQPHFETLALHVRTERHYHLVPADQPTDEELLRYALPSGSA